MSNEELVQDLKQHFTDDKFEELLEDNRALINVMIAPYRTILPADDLMQAARIGIWQAIEKYDSEQGAAFFTYAEYYVKVNIHREIMQGGYCVKIPPAMQALLNKRRRFIEAFTDKAGKEPTRDEIRAGLRISWEKADLLELCNMFRQRASLSAPAGNDGGELQDFIPDKTDPYDDVERQIDFESMQRELWAAVDELPGQLPEVIRARYLRGETMADIMSALNLSKGQVERYTRKACRELYRRVPKSKSYFEVYLPTKTFPHVSVKDFQRTHYSEVERAVFHEMGIDWKSEDEPNTEKQKRLVQGS